MNLIKNLPARFDSAKNLALPPVGLRRRAEEREQTRKGKAGWYVGFNETAYREPA